MHGSSRSLLFKLSNVHCPFSKLVMPVDMEMSVTQTLGQMYEQRGYTRIAAATSATINKSDVVPEILSLCEDGTLSLKVYAEHQDGSKCYALMAPENNDKIGVSCVRKLVEACENHRVHTVTLVSDSVTPFTRKELAESAWKNTFQFFKPEELVVNVTTNFLVPKHSLVPEKVVNELVKKFGSQVSWPRLLQTDRISRHYDYVGDVVQSPGFGSITGKRVIEWCIRLALGMERSRIQRKAIFQGGCLLGGKGCSLVGLLYALWWLPPTCIAVVHCNF